MIPDHIAAKLKNFGQPAKCWEWEGSTARGYGKTSFEGQRNVYLHRLTYALEVGPIPDGYEVDHLCRNIICANPAHLEAVTPAENRRRANAAKPRLTHCLRGHERTPDNLNAGNCRKCYRELSLIRNPPKPLATHCGKGHEYTPENTYCPPSGGRQCRACKNAQKRSRRLPVDHRASDAHQPTTEQGAQT